MSDAIAEIIKLAKDRKLKRIHKRRKEAAEKQRAAVGKAKSDQFGHLIEAGATESSGRLVVAQNPLPGDWGRMEEKHPGILFGRILRATAAAKKLKRDGTQDAAIRAMTDIYKDKDLSKWMEVEFEKALSAGNPQEGGYLVAETLAAGIIDFVVNRMIAMRLGAQTLDMPTGNVRIARALSGATSYYKPENTGANASQPVLGDLKLAAKKLLTFVAISNDLLSTSSPRVDLFVRNDAVRASTLRKEQAFWSDNGTEDTPRGLKYASANSNAYDNLTPVSIGGAITADNLLEFVLALTNNKIELDDLGSYGWAFAAQIWRDLMNAKASTNQYLLREEMMVQKTLLGFPFQHSQFLRASGTGSQNFEVYFGDWSQVMIGLQGLPEVDASTEASYLVSGSLVSAYSSDQTVVRVIERHDFGVRLPNAIARAADVSSNNGT